MTGPSKHVRSGAATKRLGHNLAKIITMCFEDHDCPHRPDWDLWGAIMVFKTDGCNFGHIVIKTFGRGAPAPMLTVPSHGKFFLPRHAFEAPAPSWAMKSAEVSMPIQDADPNHLDSNV